MESTNENMKKLEAIFFVSGRFLNMQELISLTDLNPDVVKELIEKLQEKYNKQDSAIEIVEKGTQKSSISDATKSGAVPAHRTDKDFDGMWKMDVGQEYSSVINKLATGSSEFTKAEQETLAIVAFKQPIKQSVIAKIRGNKSYEHIKKFSDLGLIKKKKSGHTHELSLSDNFYDYFNVKNSGERIFDRDQDLESNGKSRHVKDSKGTPQESLKTEPTGK